MTGFSIPVRSEGLRLFLLIIDGDGDLFSYSERSPVVVGLFNDPGGSISMVLGVWGSPPASLDYLIITTRDRFAKTWLVSIFYLRSRGVRNV